VHDLATGDLLRSVWVDRILLDVACSPVGDFAVVGARSGEVTLFELAGAEDE
jgi:hypothetical protein